MPKNEKMFGRVLSCFSSCTKHYSLVLRGSSVYTVLVYPRFFLGFANHGDWSVYQFLWFRLYSDGSYRQVANPR